MFLDFLILLVKPTSGSGQLCSKTNPPPKKKRLEIFLENMHVPWKVFKRMEHLIQLFSRRMRGGERQAGGR